MTEAISELSMIAASESDLDALARMNADLIADERGANPMTLDQLRDRFVDWMASGFWRVELLRFDGETVGYALYAEVEAEHEAGAQDLYLRQLFISRARRRLGLGRRAAAMLIAERATPGQRLVLDVLAGNDVANAFWRAVGFEPYAITMERRA